MDLRTLEEGPATRAVYRDGLRLGILRFVEARPGYGAMEWGFVRGEGLPLSVRVSLYPLMGKRFRTVDEALRAIAGNDCREPRCRICDREQRKVTA